MNMAKKYISIDIGGSNTRIGTSTDLKDFKSILKKQTPKTLSELKNLITKSSGTDYDAIGIAIACPLDHYENSVIFGTNIEALKKGLKLDQLFNDTSNIYLNNDAEMAGLAEAVTGEGKNYKTVAYLTLSTGVGGSLIIDKKLPRLRYNMEPGRHIIEIGGIEGYSTKIQGEWEAYSSGTAFKKIYNENPSECNKKDLWDRYADELSIGLHNITVLWSPDVIVLGGGLTNKSDLFIEKTRSKLKSSLINVRPAPDIKISKLGDSNVLFGNLVFLRSKLNV
jgi:glucokinase